AHTLYDYELDGNGTLLRDGRAEVRLSPGSLSRAASSLWEHARKAAEEYLNYQPSAYFGEDSYMYGSFWRALGLDDGPSIREIKESGYLKRLRMYLGYAERLRVRTEPFRKLYELALQKQRQQLARDIA